MRIAPSLSLMLLGLAACSLGCSGPAPAAQFVQQADRLHEGALVSAVTRDEYLQRYVQEIGRRIIRAANDAAPQKAGNPLFAQMQFHLVDSGVVNAFTTGGRHIYVYTALLQLCDNEEELATAMSHEFAHALNLDVEHTGMKPLPDAPPAAIAYLFVTNRFTLLQERETDDLAFQLFARAGWDPNHFGNLFEKLGRLFPGPSAFDRILDIGRGEAARGPGATPPREWRQLPVADRRTFESLRKTAASNTANPPGNAELILRAFPNCLLSADTPEQRQAQKEIRPAPPTPVRLEPS